MAKLTQIKRSPESIALANKQLIDLIGKYQGVLQGFSVPKGDRELIMSYHKIVNRNKLYGLKNMINLFTTSGIYDDELKAVTSVATEMRELTDRYNIEFMAVVKIKKGYPQQYHVSNIVAGVTDNVVAATILRRIFSNPFCRYIIIHTHPNSEGYNPNVFSGSPICKRFSDLGDTSVTNILKYQSIYLIGNKGGLYKYEGLGQGENRANNINELMRIKPLLTNLAKAETRFLYDPDTKKYFPVAENSEPKI